MNKRKTVSLLIGITTGVLCHLVSITLGLTPTIGIDMFAGIVVGMCAYISFRTVSKPTNPQDTINITDPRDIAFAQIAQNSTVQNTTLPSGFKTPDWPMKIKGNQLVPC